MSEKLFNNLNLNILPRCNSDNFDSKMILNIYLTPYLILKKL
jgi:hypothetical protein